MFIVAFICIFYYPMLMHEWIIALLITSVTTVAFIFWWWLYTTVRMTYDKYARISEELQTVFQLLKETQELLKLRAEEVTHDHHNDLGKRRESTTD